MRHKCLQLLLIAAAARADLRREKKEEFPCASSYYRGRTIEKQNFAAGARGRVAYVAGLEHTGHHLWHEGVFRQPGPWRNAYDAYDVENGSQPPRHRRDFMPATTTTMDDAIDVTRHDCADDANLEKALREDLARTQGDVLLHLPSCSYPCGTAPACVEIKILRRVCPESSRRPPRHRRDACSMAWRCRFLAARPN